MTTQEQHLKLLPVDAKMFSDIGYLDSSRQLYIKFRGSPALCFAGVPRFRFAGLLAAPRKDAYYATYIKNFFLFKPVELPA